MKREVQYKYITPADFKRRLAEAPVAYLPLGTIEWHGEHLPLGADGIQSEELFGMLAEDVGGIVLPMLFCAPDAKKVEPDGSEKYGMDFWFEKDPDSFMAYPTQQLPGSIYYMEEELFGQMIFSIVKQLARAGFRLVVAHGHGPSFIWVERHYRELEEAYGVRVITCYMKDRPEMKGYMSDHAAGNETMITRALYPELVHMEHLPKEGWPLGMFGEDPRVVGTEENGRKLIRFHRERMGKIIRAILAGENVELEHWEDR